MEAGQGDRVDKKDDKKKKPKYENLGFNTAEALDILQRDIRRIIDEYEKECKKNKKYKDWLKDALHHKSQYTTFCWTSAAALLISAAMLIVSYFTAPESELTTWPYEGNILFILVIFNSILVITDNRFRHLEILSRVKHVAQQIEVAKSICYWKLEHYPHLYSPLSPCITLQYTYRDGQMVNLPWALLVAGDIIVIRPGQQAPGYCTPFEDSDGPVLHAHEIYSPPLPTGDVFSSPQPRVPLRNQRYKLQETPYLTSLRLALDQALDRPVTCFNRERHLVVICCIEQLVYPILLILILIFNLLRYLYLYEYVGIGHWTELFLLQPVTVTLPLLPIAFPIWWIILNCFGMARFKALFKLYQSSKKNQFLDPFEEGTDHSQPDVVYNWTELSRYFCAIMFGKEHMMTRSANILHVLGSVTALCCVDKKGILSWPNPTAEKVFFLHNANAAANTSSNANLKETVSHTSSMTSINKSTEPNHPNDNSAKQEQTNKSSTQHQNDGTHVVAEVLDLTHDRALPFKLQFDDQAWRQHLNSLKPLGLAILLNTCNMETQEHYARFCCHVTCEAFHNENLVPVTNRRWLERESSCTSSSRATSSHYCHHDQQNQHSSNNCGGQYFVDETGYVEQMWCLCELAKQIGFKDQAKEIFHLEQQLSTFRHVPETARVRDMKFARSLSISTKLKFPFPHMVAVVVREKNGGGLQLLTQGTADIILDSCIEFWDGHDLCPLTESEKKKVQDFYNRMSLTSYCTAFAYRPLTRSVSSHLSNVYLELPTESKHLFTPYRSPTPLPWDFRNVLDPRIKGLLGQFHSTDSLLCSEAKEDEVSSVEGCFELQCNQIFIGMVTMQYQAQTDMVTLIEQLERACIRFVHFSKENELRSRVFSEKMGLESGWNCHISLLSERARMDSPVVKWLASSSPAISSRGGHRRSLNKRRAELQMMHSVHHVEANLRLKRFSLRSNLDNSRQMSMSAPCAINSEHVTSSVRFEDETAVNVMTSDSDETAAVAAASVQPNEWNSADAKQSKNSISHRETEQQQQQATEDSVLIQSIDLASGQDNWRSLSCLTDSTEQSAPVNFDLSNRAKLPRGIDKIRPHIELIDNVPLLVSLFTDCTTAVTREMLHIMQDYGEVVCVLGSAANAENMPIFMQADAAIAVEPLYPQVCQRVAVFTETRAEEGPSPIELSRALNSVACSLSIKREDPIAVYHLIMEARHYMKCLWNCVQFWLCCVLTLALAQALSAFLLLPPLFTVGHVLWLGCVIVPVLAVSLVGTPTDPSIMQRATGKNQCLVTWEVAAFVLWCYGFKFLPTIVTVLGWQCLALFALCATYAKPELPCYYVYPNVTASDVAWAGWASKPDTLLVVQHIALVIVVLHFVTISVGFVHREYSLWRKLPFNNWIWFTVAVVVIMLQIAFSSNVLCNNWKDDTKTKSFPLHLPLYFFASLPIVLLINEFVKAQEIKLNVRYQKRARLEFTTKLGMNSPF
ncbi:transmembrane protein 94 [Trichogramma pretiosum]|uniref:transmembrane protein 94 n=1 Tax=Trichogramma pretiosum TaxID=7493 RepID=UPI0006C9C63C|nr:transmembrane protein 94 [Trichogramma pretiosum]